jgi:hypothetical protein
LAAGFDAVYDEPLYRNLKHSSDTGPAPVIGHFEYIAKAADASRFIHYCANHDDSFPHPAETAALWQVLFLCLPGHQLVYNGFWQGQLSRLAHHYVELLPVERLPGKHRDEELAEFVDWLKKTDPVIGRMVSDKETVRIELEADTATAELTVDFKNLSWSVCQQEGK